MPSLFARGINANLNMSIYPIHESWIDVGRIDDYQLANAGAQK